MHALISSVHPRDVRGDLLAVLQEEKRVFKMKKTAEELMTTEQRYRIEGSL